MIIFKDPVPKGVNRGEAVRMGETHVELHVFKHGYEAEAFLDDLKNERMPDSISQRAF